jgi:polar amino acid transport system substrate-binding protein
MKLTLLALVFFSAHFPAHAAPTIELKTAAQDSSKTKFDPSNPDRPGVSLEIIKAVEKADPGLKFPGKENLTPLLRIEQDLEGGHTDVFFGFIKNEKREAKMRFEDPPVFTVRHKVAVAKGDDVSVSSFDDIRKLGDKGEITTLHGSAFHTFLEKQGGLQLSTAMNVRANIEKVLIKRARFHYNTDLNLSEMASDAEFKNKYKILPAVFSVEHDYVAFGKHVPEEKVKRVMAAVNKIIKNGELAKIHKKYYLQQ